MPRKSPYPDDLPFSLARMTVSFRRFSDQTLRSVGLAGLAPGLASVLHALERLAPCTTGQLVEDTQFPNGTLTGLLDSLEERGLVTRLCNPDDRRSRVLGLTRKGRKLCGKLRERHSLSLAFLKESLGERDAAQLARLLDKASKALGSYDPPKRARGSRPSARP